MIDEDYLILTPCCVMAIGHIIPNKKLEQSNQIEILGLKNKGKPLRFKKVGNIYDHIRYDGRKNYFYTIEGTKYDTRYLSKAEKLQEIFGGEMTLYTINKNNPIVIRLEKNYAIIIAPIIE